MEPTPAAPPPGNDYNFIMDPEKPKKKGVMDDGSSNSFIAKIVLLVGGAVALIIVLTIGVNLLFGGKSNIEMVVNLTQQQQEIVRLAAEGENAIGQEIRNASINTRLSVRSQQQSWMTFLGKRGRTVPPEELNLKKDSATDNKLKLAEQTSTFDTTYATVMRSELEDYAGMLKSTFDGTANKEERQMLSLHYNEVQLLLEQWPGSTVGFASH